MNIFNKIDQKVGELHIDRIIKFLMKVYNFIAFENMITNWFIMILGILFINNNGGDAEALLSDTQIEFIKDALEISINIVLFSIVLAIPFLFRRSFFVLIWLIIAGALLDVSTYTYAVFIVPIIIFVLKILIRRNKTHKFTITPSEKIYITTAAIPITHIIGIVIIMILKQL
jgi:hypothetical protein